MFTGASVTLVPKKYSVYLKLKLLLMKKLSSIFLLITSLSFYGIAQDRPASHPAGMGYWEQKYNRSDEFNDDDVNTQKWNNTPENFGVWTWDTNNTFITDGKLNIQMTQETHTRRFWDGENKMFVDDFELYYKSGILKSFATGVYGYYEAKIKGASLFPGVSPAFWLYSDGHPYDNMEPGSIQYSEIDVVELQQAEWTPEHEDDVYDMDHNLHTRIANDDGKTVSWMRPGTHPEECQNKHRADFDPRDDFHIYAVENRVDSIIWYVDGVQIAAKPNTYWHRPMHVTLSMGLRRHFTVFHHNQFYPNPDATTTEGFPTIMQVDYVRVWEAKPSLWINDKDGFLAKEYKQGESIDLKCFFNAGSGDTVMNVNGGLACKFMQMDENNAIVKEFWFESDASAIGAQGGYADFSIPVDAAITPTADLPDGHKYVITPYYKSSAGNFVYINGGLKDVKIVAGEVETETVILTKGWNLIGYPYKDNKTVETAFSSIWDEIELIKDFDKFYDKDDPALSSLKNLKWSRGYFVKVSEQCELTW